MLLYRYFGSHAFETLKKAKLKTSRISDFNDPFEFLFVPIIRGEITPEAARGALRLFHDNPALLMEIFSNSPHYQQQPAQLTEEIIQQSLRNNQDWWIATIVKDWPVIKKGIKLPTIQRRRQVIDKELRAICFSDADAVSRQNDILLWSHYTKGHKGVRIGFEFPKAIFQIVGMKYKMERVRVDVSFWLDDVLILKALEESATVKSKAWEYEGEYRLFTKTGRCEPIEIQKCDSTTTVEHFLEFKREWVKTVDFGALYPEAEVQPFIELLKKEYPNAVCRKTEFHETEYALEYKQIH
jgi:hypothetical protein